MGRHVCEMLTHQFWTPTTRTVHPVLPDVGSPQRALTSTPTAGPFYLANRFTISHGKFSVCSCLYCIPHSPRDDCQASKAECVSQGLKFETSSAEADSECSEYPTCELGEEMMGGFSEDRYERCLGVRRNGVGTWLK